MYYSGIEVPAGSVVDVILGLLGQYQTFPRFSAEIEALMGAYKSLIGELDTLNYQKQSLAKKQAAQKAVGDFYSNM